VQDHDSRTVEQDGCRAAGVPLIAAYTSTQCLAACRHSRAGRVGLLYPDRRAACKRQRVHANLNARSSSVRQMPERMKRCATGPEPSALFAQIQPTAQHDCRVYASAAH
jgi:hypothetical protein